jgi:hypothetical protein
VEAVIVALFALLAIVLLEAGYWMAISLARRAPVVAAGALVGWLAERGGANHLDALGLGLVACLVARNLWLCWARADVAQSEGLIFQPQRKAI